MSAATFDLTGGMSTTTNLTVYYLFTTKTVIESFSVPVVLDDTDAIKSVTLTITYGSYTFTDTKTWSETARNDRIAAFTVGSGFDFNSNVAVNVTCSNCTINYGSTSVHALKGGAVFNSSNSFESTMTISYDAVMEITAHNNAYPHTINFPPDESIFEGYNPPKPFNSWKIDANNRGYPWTWGFTDLAGQNIFLKQGGLLYPQTLFLKKNGKIIPLFFINKK